MRQYLLDLFQKALDAVHGQHCVHEALNTTLPFPSDCMVVAIGKAAHAMALGAQQALDDKLVKGLVITKYEHSNPEQLSEKWQVIESAHPVPDHNSLKAGQHLLDLLKHPEYKQHPVLFLLSGGTSSLVEVLAEDYDHDVLQQVNNWCLASGLAIEQVNHIRKSLSQIKGGKLLHFLQERNVHTLLLSDVPGDHPHVIGSGLLFPYEEQLELTDLPDWLAELVAESQTSITKMNVDKVSHQIVASNQLAKDKIKQVTDDSVHQVYVHDEFLQDDAAETGRRLAEYLQSEAKPGIHIWGGETTVMLPDAPGRGGRNQHLALSAAMALKGSGNITFLAAGTDGTDGPTDDAGAIVDGETISRGELSGLDAEQCLGKADSGSFLEAAGDLISTGPTGTNVMDLVIAIKTR